MYCGAALILGVDLQENVRIRPNVLRHGSLYGDRLFGIVRRVSVMREKREGRCQKAHNEQGNGSELVSHRIPPLGLECTRPRVPTAKEQSAYRIPLPLMVAKSHLERVPREALASASFAIASSFGSSTIPTASYRPIVR